MTDNWRDTYERYTDRMQVLDLDRYPTLNQTKPYHETSDRYAFVPTMDVINYLSTDGWTPCEVREGQCRKADMKGYQKHMVRFKNLEYGLVDEDEGIFAEMVLTGAHNGMAVIDIHIGFRRFTCTNTMSVSESVVGAFKVKHLGDAYQQTMFAARNIKDALPRVADSMREYKDITMSSLDKVAYARAAVECKYDDEFLDSHYVDALALLKPKRRGDAGDSLWKTFNIVQEKLLNGGLKTLQKNGSIDMETGLRNTPRHNTSRKVKDVKEDVRLNKALWTLTEHFAQEKRMLEL
jgi:hypothetical protein